jgi:hypothetical protein
MQVPLNTACAAAFHRWDTAKQRKHNTWWIWSLESTI